MGTLGGMLFKVSNRLNDTKRDLEKAIDKSFYKTDRLENKVNEVILKLDTRLSELIIVLKFTQDKNSSRIKDIENFLHKNHQYGIKESSGDSKENFDKLPER